LVEKIASEKTPCGGSDVNAARDMQKKGDCRNGKKGWGNEEKAGEMVPPKSNSHVKNHSEV